MLHYFYGEDTYGARQAIADLAARQSATLVWLDRVQLEEQGLTTVFESKGLFGQRLCVIYDPSLLPKVEQEQIIKTHSAGEAIAWDRGDAPTTSLIYRHCRKTARHCTYPAHTVMRRWLVESVRERGGDIEERAAAALIERAGPDRWRLLNEIDRLLLSESRITQPLLDATLPPSESATIFECLDLLVRGYAAAAIRKVETLLHEGASELYLLSMLGYQVRVLLLVRRALDTGILDRDIAQETQLKPFVVKKNLPIARSCSATHLLEQLRKIMATDFAIKQGKMDARTAVLMLLITFSLSQRKLV